MMNQPENGSWNWPCGECLYQCIWRFAWQCSSHCCLLQAWVCFQIKCPLCCLVRVVIGVKQRKKWINVNSLFGVFEPIVRVRSGDRDRRIICPCQITNVKLNFKRWRYITEIREGAREWWIVELLWQHILAFQSKIEKESYRCEPTWSLCM